MFQRVLFAFLFLASAAHAAPTDSSCAEDSLDDRALAETCVETEGDTKLTTLKSDLKVLDPKTGAWIKVAGLAVTGFLEPWAESRLLPLREDHQKHYRWGAGIAVTTSALTDALLQLTSRSRDCREDYFSVECVSLRRQQRWIALVAGSLASLRAGVGKEVIDLHTSRSKNFGDPSVTDALITVGSGVKAAFVFKVVLKIPERISFRRRAVRD